jgi:hypothetical protein
VHKLGGSGRWFRLTVWTGIAEIAACRTDVSIVVIACSRSIVVGLELRWRSRVAR